MTEERISTACPSCSARMRLPAEAIGRRVRCPKCSGKFAVTPPETQTTSTSTAAAGNDVDIDALAALSGGEALETAEERQAKFETLREQAQQVGKRTRETAVDESAPMRSRASPMRWVTNFLRELNPVEYAGRVYIAMILVGGALAVYGIRAGELSSRYRAKPDTITCAELLNRKSGGNAHIVLTDFVMLPDYVYEQKMSRWTGAWVPIISTAELDREIARVLGVNVAALANTDIDKIREAKKEIDPTMFPVRIIVAFPNADGEKYMDRMFELDSLDCSLASDFGIGGLNKQERRLLEDAYANSNLSRCRILRFGPPQTSEAQAGAYQFGGGGLVVLAIVIAAVRAARSTE